MVTFTVYLCPNTTLDNFLSGKYSGVFGNIERYKEFVLQVQFDALQFEIGDVDNYGFTHVSRKV